MYVWVASVFNNLVCVAFVRCVFTQFYDYVVSVRCGLLVYCDGIV